MSNVKTEDMPSKTPRPGAVSILGKIFRIEYVHEVDSDDSYGSMDGGERVIHIKENLREDLFEDTLMHEIIHAIMYLSGNTQTLESDKEEAMVLALEIGLSQLYKRRFK